MKTKLKVLYWLASVMIITSFAGCAYRDDHYRGGYGGYEHGGGEIHHDWDHHDWDHDHDNWDHR